MKRRTIGLGLSALVVFAGLFYLYGGHQTPSGQAPLFVVWEPVLASDLSAPSTITLRRIHDARVKQYWDRNRVLSHAMGEHDRPTVVWDYIAVYKPEQIWTEAPPQPTFTGRPVVRFIDGTREALQTIYSEKKTELR